MRKRQFPKLTKKQQFIAFKIKYHLKIISHGDFHIALPFGVMNSPRLQMMIGRIEHKEVIINETTKTNYR